MEKWVPLYSNDKACRKILASEIKEYSFQRIEDKGDIHHNDPPSNRWILNISWDRGGAHGLEGDSLFFNSFTEMAKFIGKYLDPDI